ncbi:hypothetical protein CEXT_713961 [Caerostris extrusa]|uniref:Uncharacterized protein n=1 Tax=Caerostris extrusa TaxID=172846 RepID=A0AAV4N331_CAEEX|nr:hypothetical protein CEXT_713961 [Caerostris extrusa]
MAVWSGLKTQRVVRGYLGGQRSIKQLRVPLWAILIGGVNSDGDLLEHLTLYFLELIYIDPSTFISWPYCVTPVSPLLKTSPDQQWSPRDTEGRKKLVLISRWRFVLGSPLSAQSFHSRFESEWEPDSDRSDRGCFSGKTYRKPIKRSLLFPRKVSEASVAKREDEDD